MNRDDVEERTAPAKHSYTAPKSFVDTVELPEVLYISPNPLRVKATYQSRRNL